MKKDLLSPGSTLLIKLGSIAVHADEIHPKRGEMFSKDAHPFDVEALRTLLDDQEVKEWLSGMDKLAFLPKKRNA